MGDVHSPFSRPRSRAAGLLTGQMSSSRLRYEVPLKTLCHPSWKLLPSVYIPLLSNEHSLTKPLSFPTNKNVRSTVKDTFIRGGCVAPRRARLGSVLHAPFLLPQSSARRPRRHRRRRSLSRDAHVGRSGCPGILGPAEPRAEALASTSWGHGLLPPTKEPGSPSAEWGGDRPHRGPRRQTRAEASVRRAVGQASAAAAVVLELLCCAQEHEVPHPQTSSPPPSLASLGEGLRRQAA